MKVARTVWILTKFKRIVRDGIEDAKTEEEKAYEKLADAADAAIKSLTNEDKEVYDMKFNRISRKADITFFKLEDDAIKSQGNIMLGKMKEAGIKSIVFSENNSVQLENLTIEKLAQAVFTASGTDKASINEDTETISIKGIKVATEEYKFDGFTVNFSFKITPETK